MRHDPERSAAAYLAGVMRRRARIAFERHILRCEDCWREVFTARRGRSVAESAREVAPQRVREMVRSTIAAVPPPRRRLPLWLLLGLAAALLVAGTALLTNALGERQPPPIAAVLADFRAAEPLRPAAPSPLPRQLGDLELVEVRAGNARGHPVVVHHYQDDGGRKVAVYRSTTPFPDAAGAEHSSDGRTWSARIDEIHIFCADDPVPSLVVGRHAAGVQVAVEELGLR